MLTAAAGMGGAAVLSGLSGAHFNCFAELLGDLALKFAWSVTAAARESPLDLTAWVRALVPRAVDPSEVALPVRQGSFTAPRAEHAALLKEQMNVLTCGPRSTVAAAGQGGVPRFAVDSATTKKKER